YRFAAEALVSLGRWREAVTSLEAYLEKNPNVSDAADVRERISKIRAEHYPAQLHIVVNAQSATVSVDGELKGPAADLDLSPRSHRVDVTARGWKTATQEVSLEGDRATTVVFTLTAEAAETPSLPPPEPPKEVAPPWKTIGWIGVGVGAAVLVTTAIIDAAVL